MNEPFFTSQINDDGDIIYHFHNVSGYQIVIDSPMAGSGSIVMNRERNRIEINSDLIIKVKPNVKPNNNES